VSDTAVSRIPVTYDDARAQFPVLERFAYLQAGSVAPLARSTIQAMRLSEEEGLRRSRQPRAVQRISRREELRAQIAALVGVLPDRVALTASTTDGCNIVLSGLDLREGDEVITTTDEHFGLLGPLHMSRATVVVVEPDAERILTAILREHGSSALSRLDDR
jgi:L-cysteine/cystine lyase